MQLAFSRILISSGRFSVLSSIKQEGGKIRGAAKKNREKFDHRRKRVVNQQKISEQGSVESFFARTLSLRNDLLRFV